jgi:hypothetical protein
MRGYPLSYMRIKFFTRRLERRAWPLLDLRPPRAGVWREAGPPAEGVGSREYHCGMRFSSFELFGIEGAFEAFTADDHWNGWECPFFTRSEGLSLVEAWNAARDEARGPARYDIQNDRFEVTLGGEIDTFGPESIEGVTLYPIGAYGWCWEECGGKLTTTNALRN